MVTDDPHMIVIEVDSYRPLSGVFYLIDSVAYTVRFHQHQHHHKVY